MSNIFIYNSEYTKIIGDLKAGLLFSYLLNYNLDCMANKKNITQNNYFIFDIKKFVKDTGLTETEITNAIQILNDKKLIEIRKKLNKTRIKISENVNGYIEK